MRLELPTFKTDRQLETMREAGLQLFELFRQLSGLIRPGMTGMEIDAYCRKFCHDRDLEPILPGHEGFTGAICLNVNALAAHGEPRAEALAPGAVVTVDTAVRLRGLCADAAWTFALPPVSPQTRRLVDGAWRVSCAASLAVLRQHSLAAMGKACRDEAELWQLNLLKRFGGHGIGRQMHEEPRFDHWGMKEGVDFGRPGLALSVEPILTLGRDEVVQKPDGSWFCGDGLPCAQFEHNLAPLARDGRGLCLTVPDERIFFLDQAPF